MWNWKGRDGVGKNSGCEEREFGDEIGGVAMDYGLKV